MLSEESAGFADAESKHLVVSELLPFVIADQP
jgi:hypothetical protein